MKENLGLNEFLMGYKAACAGQVCETSASDEFIAGCKDGQKEISSKKKFCSCIL